MKTTTKLTIKLFLIVSLFVSAAFADDGHMPGGDGYNNDDSSGSVCVADEGHMPGGDSTTISNGYTSEDSILKFVKNYLYSMFG